MTKFEKCCGIYTGTDRVFRNGGI